MKGILLILISLLALVVSGQDYGDLNAFIKDEQEKFDIPSTVVIWAKEGEVVFKNISRLPDLPDNYSIDPSLSLFRVGSISKPFTALAALSMINDGLIDLDTDINEYFEEPIIEYKFDQPITVYHLLTHTAGFDDFYINKSARTKEEVISLEHSVRTLMPEQVIAPGQVSTYSNYSVALLGLILEKVAQKEFSMVIKERVFDPIGMHKSTFESQAIDNPNLVKAWAKSNDGLQIVPHDYIKDAPAGEMLSTVDDMIQFMTFITSTDSMAYDDAAIKDIFLKSIDLYFTHHQKLEGGIGALWSLTKNPGYPVVMHDGGYVGVMSRLFYLPQYNQSLFIFGNLMDFRYVASVTEKMMATFLPPPDPKVTSPKSTPIAIEDNLSLSDFSGYYRNTRYSRHSMLKIAALAGIGGVGGEMHLSHDDNYLIMPDHTGNPRRLVRIDTLLFSSIDDDYNLAFREEGGRITHTFTSGTIALERISFWESGSVHLIVLSTSILFFLLAVIYGLVRFIISKFKKQKMIWSLSFKLIFILSLAYILQIILLYIGGLTLEAYEFEIGLAYGVPHLFYWANALPILGILLTFILLYSLIYKTKSSRNVFIGVFFALISLAYFVSLYYWNLVGWHF